jgi:hypothetical protein
VGQLWHSCFFGELKKKKPPYYFKFQKFKLQKTKIEPWHNTTKCISYETIDHKDNNKKVTILILHLIFIYFFTRQKFQNKKKLHGKSQIIKN